MNKIEVKGRVLQEKVLDAQVAHTTKRIERGAMGWLLGIGEEKPGNLVGFAILVACAMVLLIGSVPMHADVPRRELVMLIAAIIPGALGYYFGFLTGKRRE